MYWVLILTYKIQQYLNPLFKRAFTIVVPGNTSKDHKSINSSINDTVYFKNFIGALKIENIQNRKFFWK